MLKKLLSTITASTLLISSMAFSLEMNAVPAKADDGAGATSYLDEFFEKSLDDIKMEMQQDSSAYSRHVIMVSINEEQAKKLVAELEPKLADIGADFDGVTISYYQLLFEKMHLAGLVPEELLVTEYDGGTKVVNVDIPSWISRTYNAEKGCYELKVSSFGDADIYTIGGVFNVDEGNYSLSYNGKEVVLDSYELSQRILYTANTYGDKSYFDYAYEELPIGGYTQPAVTTTATSTTTTTGTTSTAEPVEVDATEAEKPSAELINGDVNNDKKVTSEDATYVLIEYAKALNDDKVIKAETLPAGDFNADGYVDALDATDILIDYAERLLND